MNFGTKYQFVIVQIHSQKAFLARKIFADVAAKPDGFTGLDRGGGQVHQSLNRLIIVDGGLGAHHISQAVHGVGFPGGVIWTGVSHQAHFVGHVVMLSDVVIVELQRRNWTNFSGSLGLVNVFPCELCWWNTKANADNAEIRKICFEN